MKKAILIVALVVFNIGKTTAQSQIINDFRKIVAERTTAFKNLQGELLQDNVEKGVKIYSTSIGNSVICKAFITQSNTFGGTFLLVYNIEEMDAMKLTIFNNMASQYITELNDMVKTGNYKGRDYNEGSDSVTEIKDLNDNVVVKYVSNDTQHMIMVLD